MAGLLVVEGCLVRIKLALREATRMELVGCRDRVVIPERTMTKQDLVDKLLALD